jgi:hypothetical protein
VFEANDMLFRSGKKDTLVMTEVNFTESGFWASQWWYNIPPIGGPPNEFDYKWDAVNTALNVATSGLHFGPDNLFVPGVGYDGTFVILSAFDITGSNIQSTVIGSINTGDVLRVANLAGSKAVSFATTNDPIPIGDDRILVQINPASISFVSSSGNGFLDNEQVTVVNTSASTGLAEDVEWNNFHYYHDHNEDGSEYCPVEALVLTTVTCSLSRNPLPELETKDIEAGLICTNILSSPIGIGSFVVAKETAFEPARFATRSTSPVLIDPITVDCIFEPVISNALRITNVPS